MLMCLVYSVKSACIGKKIQEEFCREDIRMSSRKPGGFWIQVDQVDNANQVSQVVQENQVAQVDEVKQAQSAGLWDAARRGLLHQVLLFKSSLLNWRTGERFFCR